MQPNTENVSAPTRSPRCAGSEFGIYRELLLLFVSSRLLVWAVAWLSLYIVNKGPFFTPVETWLDWFKCWDARWYLDVAQNGYQFVQNGSPSNVVFLPLYPWLIHGCSLGGIISPTVVGYVISHLCLLAAGFQLYHLIRYEDGDTETARLAVISLFFGPVSFFFSAIYAEALFLTLTIGCISQARRGHWWWAGLL